MPRATKPSFVTELPLKVDSHQNRELESRFQAARQLYNACLGEAMTRLNLVRNSTAYQEARKISRNAKKRPERSEGSEAFAKAKVGWLIHPRTSSLQSLEALARFAKKG